MVDHVGDLTGALLELRSWRAFDVDEAGRVLAGSDMSGTVQLVELAPDGRVTPLTALPGPCTGRYLPFERTVVVEHDDRGFENSCLSLLRLDPLPEHPADLADLTPLVGGDEYQHRLLDVLPGRVVYATNRRNGIDFDVIVRNVVTGAEEVVYNAGGYVRQVTVARDGHRVLLTRPGIPPMSDQLVLVDTAITGDERIQPLTRAEEPARYERPQWFGDQVLVSTDLGRDHTGVITMNLSGTERRWLVIDDVDLVGRLAPDGLTLLVVRSEDGADRVLLHDALTGQRRREIALPGTGVVTWPVPDPVFSPGGRYVALSYTAPDTPGDIVLVDISTGTVRTLTDSAGNWSGPALSHPESHRITAADGERIPCFVYRPAEPNGSAVIILHGGPESQAVRSFNPVVQALALAGHTVLVPNVRGSTGYGKRWYSLDDGRRRLDVLGDLAALHDALPSLGCDPKRAALWGGSYGGYLVLAGLAFQPERWAAGVDIAGISSLVTFLENTSGYRRAHREREYGSLARDRDFLHAASPMNRVHEIRAPLLMIHGAQDPRVPLSEAEQLAAALTERGVPCTLLVYEDEGHGLARLPNKLDAYRKALTFLADTLS